MFFSVKAEMTIELNDLRKKVFKTNTEYCEIYNEALGFGSIKGGGICKGSPESSE